MEARNMEPTLIGQDERVDADFEAVVERERTNPFLDTNGAMITIVKCAIGAGSFSLPKAFMEGGLYLSFFFTLFLGLLSAYTLLILIESSLMASELLKLQLEIAGSKNDLNLVEDVMVKRGEYSYVPLVKDSLNCLPTSYDEHFTAPESILTYPEMGAIAFPEACFSIRECKFNVAYWAISIGILLTSLGVCAAYVDFISDTVPEVLGSTVNKDFTFLTRNNTPWFIMPVILCLSFLRTLKVLTYTSLIGNIAVFAGCVGVIVYGYKYFRQDVTFNHSFVEWKTLPRYVGGNTFLFAIHVVILPIMQEMDNADNNKSKRYAIAGSFSFITLFNAFFGAVGFLLFASSECKNVRSPYIGPCDNILSNMSGGSILNTVKILVCIDLLFTVPLILAASRVIIEKALFESEMVRTFQMKYFSQEINNALENDSEPHSTLSALSRESDNINSRAEKLLKSYCCIATDDTTDVFNPFFITKSEADTAEKGAVKTTKITRKNDTKKKVRTGANSVERGLTIDQRYDSLLCVDLGFFNSLVQYGVRSTLVCTVIFMAVGIPQFGDMVDLVGGLVMPFTCFLLPSAMYIRLRHHLDRMPRIRNITIPDINGNGTALTYKKKGYMSNIVYFKHVMIMIFGVMTMVGTTVVSAANK